MMADTSRVPLVQLFDPPLCCPTGLCGPTVDPELLDVSETLLALQEQGYSVERYQMSTSPTAFVSNQQVMRLVRERQMAVLPITVVHGQVIKTGSYPTRTEIEQALNRGNKA